MSIAGPLASSSCRTSAPVVRRISRWSGPGVRPPPAFLSTLRRGELGSDYLPLQVSHLSRSGRPWRTRAARG